MVSLVLLSISGDQVRKLPKASYLLVLTGAALDMLGGGLVVWSLARGSGLALRSFMLKQFEAWVCRLGACLRFKLLRVYGIGLSVDSSCKLSAD